MTGTRLALEGRVLDADCAPLAGATVDLWQADADGAYDLEGFALRGQVTTDAEGRYAFSTIVPGHYLNGSQYRPAHIHVKVGADGHALLTTQLYFEGDPYNDIDPFIKDSLVMTPLEEEGGLRATFDFVLAPADA
jgi:protocatechuate 3,4-dioxygenase beta subunit